MGSEITAHLDAQIRQMRLSDGERSMMGLFSRAAGSAVRIAGSGDPAAGFANDFLSGVMGDAVQSETQSGPAKPPDDPLGEFIDNNEQAWADRQANYEQVLAAFNTPTGVDRSQDVLVAAGPGYLLNLDGLGSTICPSQGFGADLMGIVNSDLPWADKVQMTRDTIAHYYRNSSAFQGWVQTAGGGAEMLGGLALSGVPGGIIPGYAAIVHGADNYVAVLLRYDDDLTGRTVTYQLVNAATGSPWLADAVDRGIPFATGVAGAAAALNAAHPGRLVPNASTGPTGVRADIPTTTQVNRINLNSRTDDGLQYIEYQNGQGWIYPANLGFSGPTSNVTLPLGTRLDRVGGPTGSFLAPAGIGYEGRSSPPGSGASSVHRYEVIGPLPVIQGEIAPAFGQPGGGVQILPDVGVRANFQWLLDHRYIREVK